MKAARIKGALVGVEAVTPEGLKDVYKDFNYAGETLVERLRAFKAARRARARLVHLRPADAIGRRRSMRPRAIATRAGVTFAQFVMLTPFPGTVDFAAWEKSMESDSDPDRRCAADPALAHPAGTAAQGLHAAPGDGSGRDPSPHAGRVGRLLQPAENLGALELRPVAEVTARVRADLETVPADVREHRDRDRQCAGQPLGTVGANDRGSVPATLLRTADAGSADARVTSAAAADRFPTGAIGTRLRFGRARAEPPPEAPPPRLRNWATLDGCPPPLLAWCAPWPLAWR